MNSPPDTDRRHHWRRPEKRSTGEFPDLCQENASARASATLFCVRGFPASVEIIGTEEGIHRRRDVRRVADEDCWDKDLLNNCVVTFREYLDPTSKEDDKFEIPVVSREDVPEAPSTGVGGGSHA